MRYLVRTGYQYRTPFETMMSIKSSAIHSEKGCVLEIWRSVGVTHRTTSPYIAPLMLAIKALDRRQILVGLSLRMDSRIIVLGPVRLCVPWAAVRVVTASVKLEAKSVTYLLVQVQICLYLSI